MRPRQLGLTLLVTALVAAACSSEAAQRSSPASSPGSRAAHPAVPTTGEPPSASPNASIELPAASPDAWLVVGRRNRAGLDVILASSGEQLYDLPVGIPSPDWGQVLSATVSGGSTTVRRLAVQPGFGGDAITIPGAWQLPAIGLDALPGGVSLDGTTIALVARTDGSGGTAQTSRFAILSAVLDRQPKVIELAGSFAYDTLSPDGATLYVIEHLPAPPTGHYQVRAVDVASGLLRDGVVVDKTNLSEAMGGYPISQLSLASGRVLTLYQGAEHPFVHALDTIQGWAVCIDLPAGRAGIGAAAARTAEDWGLAASPDGGMVFAVNATLGLVESIDPAGPVLRSGATVEPLAGLDIVEAKFGHQPGGPAARRVVVTPDGRTILAAGSAGIMAIDAASLRVTNRYLVGKAVDAVAVTPDGGTIFALLRQGGRIVRLAATSGTVQATVSGTDYDRLLGVIPW